MSLGRYTAHSGGTFASLSPSRQIPVYHPKLVHIIRYTSITHWSTYQSLIVSMNCVITSGLNPINKYNMQPRLLAVLLNKTTVMQQRFLLQVLLLAQHVSGTTMPIIRSSRVLYSGCCLWYFVLWFSSCWSGVELSSIVGIVMPETC